MKCVIDMPMCCQKLSCTTPQFPMPPHLREYTHTTNYWLWLCQVKIAAQHQGIPTYIEPENLSKKVKDRSYILISSFRRATQTKCSIYVCELLFSVSAKGK